MRNIRTIFGSYIVCLLCICLSACQQDNADGGDSTNTTLDKNLVRNRESYDEGIKTRVSNKTAEFQIEDIQRETNVLTVFVSEVCNPEAFTFIWDGRLAESYPLQARLLLTYDGTAGSCDKGEIFQVKLDLGKLQLSST